MKKFFLMSVCVLFFIPAGLPALDRDRGVGYQTIEPRTLHVNRARLLELPDIDRLGGYGYREETVKTPEEPSRTLDREMLQRLAYIYRVHLLSLEAQVSDDLVSAEEYITDGLLALQTLMDEHPEIQNSRQFAELYRTVMTEYQEFYGITDTIVSEKGEIFQVHRDMMQAEEDDWFSHQRFLLPEDLETNQTQVPLIRNQQVNNHIAYLTVRRPEIMERWLERSAYYFPMMREIFQDEGVPEELIHLSMIESGLVPTASSSARAVGLWQFIYATGSVYGLERNWWIDERRDPVKSTRAAARHLRDLHEYWNGDWHLALANYNVSTRRMLSSVRLAGGERNYWEIYPFLPRETRGYVPGYIAATLIAMNPEDFGFDASHDDVVPYSFDVVDIEGSVELSVLAEAAGITTQELRNLNPELLRWATPPGDNPYPLKIPAGTTDAFMEAYREIPEEKRINNLVIHTVKRGETLGLIANRYGTTVRSLYQANEGLSSIIHPGQDLVIPVPDGGNVAIRAEEPSRAQTARQRTASQAPSPNRPANSAAVTYVVKSGDTVGHIAEWFDTQAWRVRSWNNIGNLIRPGQRLTLYVPANLRDQYAQLNDMTRAQRDNFSVGSATTRLASDEGGHRVYTVQRNDNLSNIARSFNTTVGAIQSANNLQTTRIYPGQTLRIPN
ncbi:LysM peptidoglycan-binding domain-containing protein [Balneolales bacterium ANBcel1]|nr:LysM peptidoglycan-binding domain-containing protein [Balneolales bacterium ANBcel1]